MKIKFAIETEMEITHGCALLEGKEREFLKTFQNLLSRKSMIIAKPIIIL